MSYDGSADAIRNATFTPDSLADELEKVKQSSGYTTGGSSNAYTITASPVVDSYEEGQIFYAELNHTNTGATTMEWVSGSAKTLTDKIGNAFSGDELKSGAIHKFYYDGTNVRALSAIARQTWTPTYGQGGGGSWSSITTQEAHYYDDGDFIEFYIKATGTTSGTVTYLNISLPQNCEDLDTPFSCSSINPGYAGGIVRAQSSTNLRMYQYDGGNWPTTTGVGCAINGRYRKA